jgi:hypothetical protein
MIQLSRVQEGAGRFTRLAMLYPVGDSADAVLKRGSTLTFRGAAEHDQLSAVFAAIAKREHTNEAIQKSFTAVVPALEVPTAPARAPQHRTIRAADLDDEKGLF